MDRGVMNRALLRSRVLTLVARGRRILLMMPLAAVIGCGSGLTPPASTGPYLNLNGNWEAIGTSGIPPALTTPIAAFMGALQSSGGVVTGTLRAFDASNFLNPCVPFTQGLPVTGTLSSGGNLVLTVPISGGTATLTATLGSTLQTFATGTWQIVGGDCAMPSTSMAITQFAPVTGTYVGTLTSSLGSPTVSSTITAVLTQSATPDAEGQFPLTGTVTSTGVCAGTGPLVPELVSGNGIFTVPGGMGFPGSSVSGAFLPSGATIQVAVVGFYDLNCLLVPSLDGTLTKQ
jgi:hypothetical protein